MRQTLAAPIASRLRQAAAPVLPPILFLLLLAPTARAQGCAACRDSTAGSAPRAREGLRRAILALGIPAGGVFAGILLLARKMDRDS